MSIIRDLVLTIPSLEERSFVTCSTGNQAPFSGGTTANIVQSSDGAVGIAGRVIDRLTDLTKDLTLVASPATYLYSTRGSTEADRKLVLGAFLQHGDSSGGGDMAVYSSGSQSDDNVFHTSARTTDHGGWTTGSNLRYASHQSYYDLRTAKRFIRAMHTAVKNKVTTESSGDEGARIGGTISFIGGSTPKIELRGAGSTSTST